MLWRIIFKTCFQVKRIIFFSLLVKGKRDGTRAAPTFFFHTLQSHNHEFADVTGENSFYSRVILICPASCILVMAHVIILLLLHQANENARTRRSWWEELFPGTWTAAPLTKGDGRGGEKKKKKKKNSHHQRGRGQTPTIHSLASPPPPGHLAFRSRVTLPDSSFSDCHGDFRLSISWACFKEGNDILFPFSSTRWDSSAKFGIPLLLLLLPSQRSSLPSQSLFYFAERHTISPTGDAPIFLNAEIHWHFH